MTPRRFPPPWSIEEQAARFTVRDANGQALGYYFEEESGRRSAAKLLTKERGERDRSEYRQFFEFLDLNQINRPAQIIAFRRGEGCEENSHARQLKTTGRVFRRHFVYFMCLRFLGPKYAPDVGRRRRCAASYFSFADEYDIFTIRLDGKN